jgi:multiple sugar transport system permease protein
MTEIMGDAIRPAPYAPSRSRARNPSSERAGFYLVLPFLIAFVLVLVVPIGYALWLSLFRDTLVGGSRFIGLENYFKVFGDVRFWGGVVNTLLYGAILIPLVIGLSTISGLILDDRRLPASGFFRILLFIPYTFPGVIAALIWGYIYGPAFGPITQIAEWMGLPVPPMLKEGWILFSIANITLWELLGYKTLIVFTALKAIPTELEEAAIIDGSSPLQYALKVKIPLIAGAIGLNAVYSIIGTLQLFNQPAILQSIAPAVVHNSFTPNLYARNLAFVGQQYNYAGAVSFVLAALISVVSFLVISLTSRKE